MGSNKEQSLEMTENEDKVPLVTDNLHQVKDADADLHKLAHQGNLDKIRHLLQKDDFKAASFIRNLDGEGMTPVHIAARGGGSFKTETVKLLVLHDERDVRSRGKERLLDIKDKEGKTALHYAALARHNELVGVLLNEYNADPNILDNEGLSPFHRCVSQGFSNDAVVCTKTFLSSERLNRNQVTGSQQTPVHIAAGAMANDILEVLLGNEYDFPFASKDNKGLTPLHYAVSAGEGNEAWEDFQDGDTPEALACVRKLLEKYDTLQVNAGSTLNGQTALHMAASLCRYNILKTLLDDDKTDIWVRDYEGRTAIHDATAAWYLAQGLPCVKLLAESDKLRDHQDKSRFLYGEYECSNKAKESPFGIALSNCTPEVAEYFIQAHHSPDDLLQESHMNKIYASLPEALLPLMSKTQLTCNPVSFCARNQVIDADFRTLVGCKEPEEGFFRAETSYLQNLLSAPKDVQRNMLLHPLVQIFIHLKWEKMKNLAFLGIFFHFLWIILYTTLVFEIYVPNPNCTAGVFNETLHSKDVEVRNTPRIWNSITLNENPRIFNCEFNRAGAIFLAMLVFTLNLCIILKEVFQFRRNPRKYFTTPINLAQIAVVVISFVNGIPAFFSSSDKPAEWQFCLVSLGMLIGWMLSLREIAKFPCAANMSDVLNKVLRHCLNMLAFFSTIFTAFSLSLRFLLPGKGQYHYVPFALVKVFVLMTGELDFEDSFYKEDGPHISLTFFTAQLVFVVLVFTIVIVLLNIINAFTVSDVQGLKEGAELSAVRNKLEQIFELETFILATRRKIGAHRFPDFFNGYNIASAKVLGHWIFQPKVEGIDISFYSPDLKSRIKKCVVPVRPNVKDKKPPCQTKRGPTQQLFSKIICCFEGNE